MKDAKQKDSRIASINLLSNGYVCVQDKNDKHIEGLSGAWTEEKEQHLRAITPDGVEFGSWGILPHAKECMKRSELYKKNNERSK